MSDEEKERFAEKVFSEITIGHGTSIYDWKDEIKEAVYKTIEFMESHNNYSPYDYYQ